MWAGNERSTTSFAVVATMLGLIVLSALAFASCGNEAGPQPRPTIEVAPERMTLSAERARQVPGESDEEAAAIADGVLSFPEYERALFAFRACLSDKGVDMTDVVLTPRNNYTYSMRYREEDTAAAQLTIAACHTQHFNVIDELWAEHTAPSQEDLQVARDALAKCLKDYGFDLPEYPSSEDFRPLRESLPLGLMKCSVKVSDEFGLPGFAG